MRHQAEHVAAGSAQDAGDVGRRAVRVVDVAQGDPVLVREPLQRVGVGEVVAVVVRHRESDALAGGVSAGERARGRRDLQLDRAADEAELAVADQRPGQQAGLGQHLEAVAHAQHTGAALGLPDHLAHHRRAGGDGAAAQVVAEREAAGHADHVERRQLGLLVPDAAHGGAERGLHRDGEVPVAVRAGEGDDGGAHQSGQKALSSTWSTVNGQSGESLDRGRPVSSPASSRASP